MAYYILKSYKLDFEAAKIQEVFAGYKNAFFLDSGIQNSYDGRYSFFGIRPFRSLKINNQNPLPLLRKVMQEYKIPQIKNAPPFLGGAVGYLSYDLGFVFEKKIAKNLKPSSGIPDALFYFYNAACILDHFKKEVLIFSSGFPEKRYSLAKLSAEKCFKQILFLLNKAQDLPVIKANTKNDFNKLVSNFSQEDYMSAVNKVKSYIRTGDIYQANLSRQFFTQTKLSAQELYSRLRILSPSCFSAYLDCGKFQILSSSPERFLKVQDSRVSTKPMKGTRPRGKSKIKDKNFKSQLISSVKEKAELLMIVDLERNDLGRVCDYNTINVSNLRQIEAYNTVYQATSTIEGILHKNKDQFDLLKACFPGGSVTGCPKIRAMEIIDQLEPHRRSIYTGALGYLSFSQNMDFNIMIRTLLKHKDNISFCTGSGIVSDSNPKKEYEETLIKAKAIFQALGKGKIK